MANYYSARVDMGASTSEFAHQIDLVIQADSGKCQWRELHAYARHCFLRNTFAESHSQADSCKSGHEFCMTAWWP